jgi:hypothetical protein
VKYAKILSIGNDPWLLTSRRLVLESGGHQVVSIDGATELAADVLRSFDLVVVCHTVEGNRGRIIASMRAANSQIPILLLTGSCFDVSMDGLEAIVPDPTMLLREIDRMRGIPEDDGQAIAHR